MGFKPFDRVLVRDDDYSLWNPRFYEFFDEDSGKHVTISGGEWNQCILYDGNEYLCGMNDKPKED